MLLLLLNKQHCRTESILQSYLKMEIKITNENNNTISTYVERLALVPSSTLQSPCLKSSITERGYYTTVSGEMIYFINVTFAQH